MKTLVLGIALCLAAMAQDFHGVSITGTTTPTITNNSDQPLLGLVRQALDSNGVNTVTHDMNYNRILSGTLLQPGESTTYSMFGTIRQRIKRMDSTGKISMVSPGDILGHKILAVLFADGTFYSQATGADVGAWKVDKETRKPVLDANGNGMFAPDSEVQDTLFQRLSSDISTIRSVAQGMQGQTTEERGLSLSRLQLPMVRTPGVSVDLFAEGHRRDLAASLSQLSGEEQIAAINRVAALPDVRKGDR
jgi:hypothetical protein